jgi:peptide/nickel transport system permease protein
MLYAAQSLAVLENQPWLWIPPGLAIGLAVLAANFVGDGLRDALDPRMKID